MPIGSGYYVHELTISLNSKIIKPIITGNIIVTYSIYSNDPFGHIGDEASEVITNANLFEKVSDLTPTSLWGTIYYDNIITAPIKIQLSFRSPQPIAVNCYLTVYYDRRENNNIPTYTQFTVYNSLVTALVISATVESDKVTYVPTYVPGGPVLALANTSFKIDEKFISFANDVRTSIGDHTVKPYERLKTEYSAIEFPDIPQSYINKAPKIKFDNTNTAAFLYLNDYDNSDIVDSSWARSNLNISGDLEDLNNQIADLNLELENLNSQISSANSAYNTARASLSSVRKNIDNTTDYDVANITAWFDLDENVSASATTWSNAMYKLPKSVEKLFGNSVLTKTYACCEKIEVTRLSYNFIILSQLITVSNLVMNGRVEDEFESAAFYYKQYNNSDNTYSLYATAIIPCDTSTSRCSFTLYGTASILRLNNY